MAPKKKVSHNGDTTDLIKIMEARRSCTANMDVEYTETCTIGFDLGMTNGKGLPEGSSISMYSLPASGKTTLVADVIKRLIATHKAKGVPYRVLYIDPEGSLELLKSMGLECYMDSGEFIHYPGSITFAGLEDVYQAVLGGNEIYKDVKLIVVDSLTAVLSQRLLEIGVDAADFGSNAKERGRFYPKYLPRCKEKGITNMFISQVRTRQGATIYEDAKRPAITDVDIHWMDIVAKVSKSESKKKVKEVIVKTCMGDVKGQTRYNLVISTSGAERKNRFAKLPDIELLVESGKRVINVFTLREMLKGLKYIAVTGAYLKINSEFLDNFEDVEEFRDKSLREKQVNIFVRKNGKAIKEFLKSQDQYKLFLGVEDDDDDGM